jgi:PAS domain S-box-containing protein
MSPESLIPILLVDDEPKNLMAEEALLQRPDYQIVRAASGEEALRCLLTADFAVILLDVVMPGLDGYQTATLIRSRERSSRTPIIFLTAQVESPLRQFEGYTAGAVDFIFKPLTEPLILQTKVAVFADLFRQREEIQQRVAQLTAVNQQLQTEIAHRQQAEAALQRANAELEQRVQERTASLSAATEEIRTLYQNGERARRALLSMIEDQRQASETLRESRDEIQGLFKSMINAFVLFESVFDDDGHFISCRFVYINDAYERITGVKNKEVKGKTIHEVWPETEPEWIKRYGEVAVTGASQTFELYHDPTKKLYHCNVYRPSDTKDRFCVIFEDITERKRAEEMLQKKELKYRNLIEQAPDTIFLVDAEGNLLHVNRAGQKMLGYSEDEFCKMKSVDTYPTDETTVGSRRLIEMRALRAGETMQFERLMRRKDGTLFPVEINVGALVDGNTHAIIRDITERKRAEDALRQLNAELEQRVAARTAELVAKNKELETFTYSVSHDLKAPLRGIDGYSRLLIQGYADRLDDEGKFFVNTIRTATEMMSQLIDDLLAYSRLERRAFAATSVNVRPLLQALVAERAEEVHARGVTLTVDIPDATVTAEPEGLAQALRNLLDNALKFTGKIPDPHIEIGGREKEKTCMLWVRDNGIGFDMRYHDRVFEIFQRLHPAEDYPGTGIGMAIVRKTMQRMGGRVWAESAPGKGATFFLEIPR